MTKKILAKIFTFIFILSIAAGYSTVSVHADATGTNIAEEDTFENPFIDISENDYYYEAVLWAAENGITNGVSNTLFGIEQTCTRAQGITFLWRSQDSPLPDLKELPFVDVARKDYYYDAVRYAVQEQITTGYSSTTFAPAGDLTRGQFITFLWRSHGCPVPEAAQCIFRQA